MQRTKWCWCSDHRKDPFEGVLCCVMLLRYPVFPFRDVPHVIRNTPDILRAYVDTQHNQIHTVTKYTSNRKDHIYWLTKDYVMLKDYLYVLMIRTLDYGTSFLFDVYFTAVFMYLVTDSFRESVLSDTYIIRSFHYNISINNRNEIFNNLTFTEQTIF